MLSVQCPHCSVNLCVSVSVLPAMQGQPSRDEREQPPARIALRKFDIGRIGATDAILIVSPRECGKTTCVNRIVRHLTSVDPTVQTVSLRPDDLDGADETIERVMENQEKNASPTLIVSDDLWLSKRSVSTSAFKKALLNRRNLRLGSIWAVQYPPDLPPVIRCNMRWVFVRGITDVRTAKKMWCNFFGIFASFEDFKEVLQQSTVGYRWLVLDCNARANNPADCLYWMTSDE